MKNMKRCPKHGIYPARFDSCPQCNPDAKLAPIRRLTPEEHIARMSDEEVGHIWNTVHWEQGSKRTRQLCLAEYDKRVGLENWPAHINSEA